ncbi:hypothetical protein EJB05_09552, partial [Eragrostis curvula]
MVDADLLEKASKSKFVATVNGIASSIRRLPRPCSGAAASRLSPCFPVDVPLLGAPVEVAAPLLRAGRAGGRRGGAAPLLRAGRAGGRRGGAAALPSRPCSTAPLPVVFNKSINFGSFRRDRPCTVVASLDGRQLLLQLLHAPAAPRAPILHAMVVEEDLVDLAEFKKAKLSVVVSWCRGGTAPRRRGGRRRCIEEAIQDPTLSRWPSPGCCHDGVENQVEAASTGRWRWRRGADEAARRARRRRGGDGDGDGGGDRDAATARRVRDGGGSGRVWRTAGQPPDLAAGERSLDNGGCFSGFCCTGYRVLDPLNLGYRVA